VIIGVVVVLMDAFANERLFEFFNVDQICDYEEFVISKWLSSFIIIMIMIIKVKR